MLHRRRPSAAVRRPARCRSRSLSGHGLSTSSAEINRTSATARRKPPGVGAHVAHALGIDAGGAHHGPSRARAQSRATVRFGPIRCGRGEQRRAPARGAAKVSAATDSRSDEHDPSAIDCPAANNISTTAALARIGSGVVRHIAQSTSRTRAAFDLRTCGARPRQLTEQDLRSHGSKPCRRDRQARA